MCKGPDDKVLMGVSRKLADVFVGDLLEVVHGFRKMVEKAARFRTTWHMVFSWKFTWSIQTHSCCIWS
jgi:hypothetical protein